MSRHPKSAGWREHPRYPDPLVETLGMGGAVQGQRSLAYQLAYLLPFQPEQKVELLQLDDAPLQLQRIQHWLEQLQGDAVDGDDV